ncbi:hypothetical protein [Pseudonocardia ammonioxydans]|uniref:hypothetical protein n=1 Tax=Pseudonocardia ammonioxydans TaxID=260086 RepID=UPI0011601B9B|nr:hypothetical protein [Pseudonocardia ammonioxydans]
MVGVALLVLALLVGLVVSVTGMFTSDDASTSDDGASVTTTDPGAAAGNGPQAESALARRPMLALPESASMPHALSSRSAGAAITVPQPGQVVGTLVPGGFPGTEEGALGKVLAVTRAGLSGGDLQTWAQVYASVAEPGAAPPEQTPVSRDLAEFRRSAHMSPTGPRAGTTISWAPTSAMVKGTTDDGTYLVGCVLGEFVVEHEGRVVTGGYGNCLPMRRVGDQWRIASGPAAAAAPSPWPGSDEAVAAGYRELQQ